MTLQAPLHSSRTPEGNPAATCAALAQAGAVPGTLPGLSTGSDRAAPRRVGLRSPEPSPLGRPNPAGWPASSPRGRRCRLHLLRQRWLHIARRSRAGRPRVAARRIVDAVVTATSGSVSGHRSSSGGSPRRHATGVRKRYREHPPACRVPACLASERVPCDGTENKLLTNCPGRWRAIGQQPRGISHSSSATLSPSVGAEQNAPNSVPQSLFCTISLFSPRQIVFWAGMLV